MSFREKSSWISLLSLLCVFAIYFWPRAGQPSGSGFLASVVLLVVVQVVLSVAMALLSPRAAQAPRDERERLIELKATQIAYGALASGVALACVFGGLDPARVFNATALLFILVVAEVLKSGWQIVQYRFGA